MKLIRLIALALIVLRCGDAKMERDMDRSLRSEEHPSIEFRFELVLRAGGTR